MNIISGYAGSMVVPTVTAVVSSTVTGVFIGLIMLNPHVEQKKQRLKAENLNISKAELEYVANKYSCCWFIGSVVISASSGLIVGSVCSGTVHTVSLIAATVL